MYTTYILYSDSLNKYYVGSTNDVDRRLSEHNRKKGKFTDLGIPWKIVYSEVFDSAKQARNRELYIKSRKSRKYIEELIQNMLR